MWVLFAACTLALAAPARRASPALIEFGWDEPSTSYLREHIAEMERMPFDGVVLNAHYKDAAGKDAVLEWTGFGSTKIPWEALQPALADLKATRFRRFTHNFLRFNTTPGDVDWFDDFSAILHNARMAARLAKQGRLRGILFDIEQYNFPLFTFGKRKYPERTFQEYERQVRRRGEEVMNAFQQEYPGLTVFMTFGYALAGRTRADFANTSYGLLGPFLDGLYAAARGRTQIVDGWEMSYPYHTAEQFEEAYRRMHEEGASITAVPDQYRRHLSAGFGIWMDLDWRNRGWNAEGPSKNPRSPQDLQSVLEAALHRCDQYVWLYCEQPRWFPPEKLPDAYIEAVRAARTAAGMPNPK